MKVTKSQLKQIIKEEVRALSEQTPFTEDEQRQRQSAKLLKYIDDHPSWADHRLEQYELVRGVLERFWPTLGSQHKMEIRNLVRPSELETGPPEEEESAEETPEQKPLKVPKLQFDPLGKSPPALRQRAAAQGKTR